MWLDVVKDYDCEILYHPGKANVVADALSRKLDGSSTPARCMRIAVDSPLVGFVRDAQIEGMKLENRKLERIKAESAWFVQDRRRLLTRYGRVWVPMTRGVRQTVMEEAHKSRFSIHPGATKMYRDLSLSYWWPGMKRDIAWYVERCLTCRMVKAKHQGPHGTHTRPHYVKRP